MPEGFDQIETSFKTQNVRNILGGHTCVFVKFLGKVEADKPLRDLLFSLPPGDVWEDAQILPCLEYVLASKYLVTPEEYKEPGLRNHSWEF